MGEGQKKPLKDVVNIQESNTEVDFLFFLDNLFIQAGSYSPFRKKFCRGQNFFSEGAITSPDPSFKSATVLFV